MGLVAIALTSCHASSETPPSLCPTPDPNAHPVHITADKGAVMALFSDGAVWCWGDASVGECTGFPAFYATPHKTTIACANGISRGGDGGILKRFDGRVEVWSQNQFGELADAPTPTNADSEPAFVGHLLAGSEVQSAGTAELFLDASGNVDWWGTLTIDPLHTLATKTPTRVTGLPAVSTLRASDHVCAIANDRRLFCWGNNDYGQLGDGTTDSRATPGQVGSLPAALAIATGEGVTCAVDDQGTVYCWGLGDDGLLGRGDPVPPPSPLHVHDPLPAPVVSIPPASSVAAGDGFLCALSTDGVPYCWGNVGGVDPAAKFPISTPHAIAGLDGVVELALGTEALCALKADHTVWCVGEGSARGHQSFDLEQLTFP